MNELITSDIKMTSLDIAEVTGKQHKHVLADIRKEIEELGEEISQPIFRPSTYINGRGKEYPCYEFGKDGAMQLALKYDAKTRYNVIKYVEQLEGKPQLPMSNTKLLLETALKHETKLEEIESDVTYLKGNMRIDSLQQQDLQAAGKRAVVHAMGGMDSIAYEEMSGKVFSAFWKEFKQHFGLPRYPDLPKSKFDEAIQFIALWRPNTSLQLKIDQCNAQMRMG